MSKVTSLSAQLKRLQVPQTAMLSRTATGDSRRASFLFDPKEAATLDAEAVYCIGMNGLEQLKAIDRDTFSSFEATLFAPSSVTYERIVQTREANAKLDLELRRFLLNLAPYFMLKPSHKCLEWLIFKYKVHVYNVDDLFACTLAYHESNYFVRMLQLVDLETDETNSKWSWLLDNKKRGVRLASTTLATHLFSDLTLFNFIIASLHHNLAEFAPDSDVELGDVVETIDEQGSTNTSSGHNSSPHKATCLNFLFSFLSKLLLESVKQLAVVSATGSKKNVNNKQQESFFALLLPVLFAGLKSNLVQYKQLSHLVLAFLFEKFPFNSKTVNKALFCVCKGVSHFRDMTSENLDQEAIECVKSSIVTMCLLVQSQLDHQIDEQQEPGCQPPLMKRNFFDKLLKNFSANQLEPLLLATLDELNQSYRIDKFLKCLLVRLIEVSVEYDTSTGEEKAGKRLTLDLDRNDDDERQLSVNETNNYFRLLVKLLGIFNLNKFPRLVELIIFEAFRLLVAQLELNNLPNLYVEYHLCEIIYRLESKYPVLFDKCLNLFLEPTNHDLTKRGRAYFLNTISFKFSSLRCRHTFKYQQIDTSQEFNLVQALAHANPAMRANALKFLRTCLEGGQKHQFQLDLDFIRAEIDSKLRHESSAEVLGQLLAFGLKLADFFPLADLIGDRLMNVFTRALSTPEWDECRLSAIELIFTQLYVKNGDKKDEFFDCLLRVGSSVFHSDSSSIPLMIQNLRKTAFFAHLSAESHSNGESSTSPIKKFYPQLKSSSANGSSNGHHTTSSESELDCQSTLENNELFEQFVQSSVKYMLARGRKTNLIAPPASFAKCASQLVSGSGTNVALSLQDLLIYEISVRVCAQSLFFTNAAFYFNLAADILINLTGERSVFNLKLKRLLDQDPLTQRANQLSNYKYLVTKQTIKNPSLLVQCYSTLFKSISIQASNFVTGSIRPQIEKCLNRVYKYLCELATNTVSKHASATGAAILGKFVESSLFTNALTSSSPSAANSSHPTTPTKLNAHSTSGYSFFQFAFKFLINFEDESGGGEAGDAKASSQIETIRLYEANLSNLLEASKRTDGWLLSTVIIALVWSLTNRSSQTRLSALKLVENLHERLADDEENSVWKQLLKKVLKHKQEIEMDGGDYMRVKLNKIINSDAKLAETLVEHVKRFLALSVKTSGSSPSASSTTAARSNSPRGNHLTQFSSNLDSGTDLDIKCLALVKFKLILLHLLALVNDELKLRLTESVFGLLVAILNESSSLVDSTPSRLEMRLNEASLALLVDSYLLTASSFAFFNKHEKFFDYLVGYLNNNSQENSAQLLRFFKRRFMSKLGAENEHKLEFWPRLHATMQVDLLKCTFDLWLSNSSRSLESTLVTSESIQENIDYLDSIKNALVSFHLSAQHYVCLLVERANMDVVSSADTPAGVNTTKEMRKQLKKINCEKKIEWRSVRLVLDLLQAKLAKAESEMDVDSSTGRLNTDLFELIPYLFTLLDSAENKYLAEAKSSESGEQLMNTSDWLHIENMCLNALLAIYRLNKVHNRARLDTAKFNIELLMQILQTKPDGDEKPTEDDDDNNKLGRLNVQHNVLLLLSEIASIFPDKVLEHVLIMFVFVGNKLTRKDDAYSFEIINQIIKSILPAIVSSCIEKQAQPAAAAVAESRLTSTVNKMQRQQKELPYVSSLVCKILQSFVVALPHIPAHRKTLIFRNLMSVIGLGDYLWITLVQSIDHYLVQNHELLEFKTNLEQFQHQQKELLANRANPITDTSAGEKKLRNTLLQCMESLIALHVQFEPSDVLQSSIYLTTFLNKYIGKLLEKAKTSSTSQPETPNKPNKLIYSHLACQLDFYNLQQMKYLAYSMLTFVSDMLVAPEFIAKLADDSSLSRATYAGLYETLIERVLLLVMRMSGCDGSGESSLLLDAPHMRKFSKTLSSKTFELLERTVQLLDSTQFVEVVRRLLRHELVPLRRRVLGLLNAKLRKYEPTESEVSLLITIVDDLLECVQVEKPLASDHEVTDQTVLFSLKLLCKRIGERHPLAFVKVLKFVSENVLERSLYWPSSSSSSSSSLVNVNLLSSVLLCCGELCLKLKSHALVYLNQIVSFDLDVVDFVRAKLDAAISLKISDEDQLIDEFEEKKTSLETGSVGKFLKKFKTYELLSLSCVTCLQKILANMANFVSPFLARLVFVSCSLSYLTSVNQHKSSEQVTAAMEVEGAIGSAAGTSISQLDAKLALLRSTIATQIPLRLLAPILSQQSIGLAQDETDQETGDYRMRLKYVEFYMQIVRLAVRQSQHEDLLANIKAIRSMFMNLFDLRTNLSARLRVKMSTTKKSTSSRKLEAFLAEQLGKYENFVIGAFVEFTFKLSEDLFRPIFFKLAEWSWANQAPKDRLITFYRCALRLSDKLKSLFVMFAPQFAVNAAELLNALNSSKTGGGSSKFFADVSSKSYAKEHVLLVNIVDTLGNVFMHDTQRTFVTKERFNLLMEPLVDELENEAEFEAGNLSYSEFVGQHLAPCVANFGSSCLNDDSLVRKLNYQILLKTKNSSVQVRLAALDVLNAFSKKIGDVYNSYLPETVPFLAELMEDPAEEVEEKVQAVIKEMEDMLGESLQSHFV